jgi:hypothetical protein
VTRFSIPDLKSLAFGVGHPIKTLPSVRGSDATSWKYERPNGVAFALHLKRYKVEPSVTDGVSRLLAKNMLRAALSDEPLPN